MNSAHRIVEARAAELAALQSFLMDFWADAKLPADVRYPFELALEEIFVNIVSYATDPTHPGTVTLTLNSDSNRVQMTISDDSAPFDPLSLDTPDTTLDLDSRGIGGLGIHLIRTMMDDVDYRHSNGQNHLIMTKQLGHDTQGTA